MENGGEAKEVDWDEVKTICKGLDKDGDKSVECEEFFVRLFLLYQFDNWLYERTLFHPKQKISIGGL